MSGAGPPKCKTCGKVEWRHLCSGGHVMIGLVWLDQDGEYVDDTPVQVRPSKVLEITSPAVAKPESGEAVVAVSDVTGAAAVIAVGAKRGRPKRGVDRKVYKAAKAREYRAKKK